MRETFGDDAAPAGPGEEARAALQSLLETAASSLGRARDAGRSLAGEARLTGILIGAGILGTIVVVGSCSAFYCGMDNRQSDRDAARATGHGPDPFCKKVQKQHTETRRGTNTSMNGSGSANIALLQGANAD